MLSFLEACFLLSKATFVKITINPLRLLVGDGMFLHPATFKRFCNDVATTSTLTPRPVHERHGFMWKNFWGVLIFIGGGNPHHMCLHQTNQLRFILEVFSVIKLKENTGFSFTFVWLAFFFFFFYQILAHWAREQTTPITTPAAEWIGFFLGLFIFFNHGWLLAEMKTNLRTVLQTLSHTLLGKHARTNRC